MIHLGTATRVCFVKFTDPSSVHVAQHLTNTVFIDRALIVVPVQDGEYYSGNNVKCLKVQIFITVAMFCK